MHKRNHRFIQSLNSFIITIITCSGKQRKEKKTKEKKATKKGHLFTLLFLCIWGFPSCSSVIENLDFKTSDDALSLYKYQFEKLKSVRSCNSSEMNQYIDEWKEVADTIYKCLEKDPSFDAHVALSMEFSALSDSIKMEFQRLAIDGKYNLHDLAVLKFRSERASLVADLNETFNNAADFFDSLDASFVSTRTSGYSYDGYQRFLERCKTCKTYSVEVMKTFIANEQCYFQNFLVNIEENLKKDLTPITRNTEECCKNIFRAANAGQIDHESALVYMAMRTNRRLLANAKVCANKLSRMEIDGREQANTYLWMVLQPFLSIDDFSSSVLTQQQKTELDFLAKRYNPIVRKLVQKNLLDSDDLEEIPKRILKLYLTTL